MPVKVDLNKRAGVGSTSPWRPRGYVQHQISVSTLSPPLEVRPPSFAPIRTLSGPIFLFLEPHLESRELPGAHSIPEWRYPGQRCPGSVRLFSPPLHGHSRPRRNPAIPTWSQSESAGPS